MDLQEFVKRLPSFGTLSETDKILHLGWFLHTEKKRERFDVEAVRQCFRDLHLEEPQNLSRDMSRLAARKALLKDTSGYRLHHDQRQALDRRFADRPDAAIIPQLLNDLPGKLSDAGERIFLTEALKCYYAKAFRATIVMSWNLAYDHLLNWILRDAARLGAFNSKIAAKVGPKRAWITIAKLRTLRI